MKKILVALGIILAVSPIFMPKVDAQGTNVHVVQKGDSMWKISVKYQIGLSEIIQANPTVKNPALIYPNRKIKHSEYRQCKKCRR